MKFRPCIDIHNGKVKQIVGSSLRDQGDEADENFVAEQDAAWFARFYRKDHLTGGHIILLNPDSSPYYEKTKEQALEALRAWPGGMQVGGGIRTDNAAGFLDAGAGAVIVTSYVFKDGKVNMDRLKELSAQVGREHLTIDLSCRRKMKQPDTSVGPGRTYIDNRQDSVRTDIGRCQGSDRSDIDSRQGSSIAISGSAENSVQSENSSAASSSYYIVTNRWQTFTDTQLNRETLEMFAEYCSEFLVHAVDVEGKQSGPDEALVRLLAKDSPIPCTYAGGISSFHDLSILRQDGCGKVDVTIGSALDLFGGPMKYEEVLRYMQ